MSSRKGDIGGPGTLVAIIVSAVIGLTAIGIFMTGIASGFANQAGTDNDVETIGRLAQVASSKCEAISSGAAKEHSWTAKISTVQELRMNENSNGYELEAIFKEGDNQIWGLSGCNYNIEGGPIDTTQSVLWSFQITPEEGNPPTITIAGTPQ